MTEYDRKTVPCRNEAAMRTGLLALLTTVILAGCTASSNKPESSHNISSVPISTETNILEGQWRYMPGAERIAAGLLIKQTGLAIVQQDGSPGQANPPINEVGTHVQVAGDFMIDATIRDANGPATIQLYGEPPIIQDEFRMPTDSIQMQIDTNNGELAVTEWTAASSKPIEQQSYTFEPTGAPNIAIKRVGGQLTFFANNKQVGSMPEHSVFDSREVWFGADATVPNTQWVLAKLGVQGLNGSPASAVDNSTFKTELDPNGLQALAAKKRYGFLFGAAVAIRPLAADTAYADTAFKNFGLMTTENALKWQATEPQQGQYTFQEGDALVRIAHQNDRKIHGHALVWAEANPRWVTELPTTTTEQKSTVGTIMERHITNEVAHYKDDIMSWDVVNEPLNDDGQLRDSVWLRAMGETYIDRAFAAAHAAAPQAELFMNMYGAETSGPIQKNYLALAERLVKRGVPITGVGLQMHVYEREDQVSVKDLNDTINKFKALGLRVRVSEMDVYSDDGQTQQADQYSAALATCIKNDNCESFTTWGVSDRYDFWKDDDGTIKQGQDFLWDNNMQPTPAVAALKRVLTEQ